LDGFPRTIIQAAGLDSILAQEKQPLNLALMLDVPDDIIVDRISSALLFFFL
jgi:adenylate kinase